MLKSTFDAVGGYNENFPLAGFEDHDLSSRLRAGNVRIFIEPNQMTWHYESDRINVESWLARKERSGITRRVATTLGHQDVSLNYSFLKKAAFFLIQLMRGLLIEYIAGNWANQNPSADLWSHKCINILLAYHIYKGYNSTFDGR